MSSQPNPVLSKPLKPRLGDSFHHVMVGDDPSVFEKLLDPAYNLAVWDNAASDVVLGYFQFLCDILFVDPKTALKSDTLKWGNNEKTLDLPYINFDKTGVEQRAFIERCNEFFPNHPDKETSIAFLSQLNSIYGMLLSKWGKSSVMMPQIRVGSYALSMNMHVDGVETRLLTSLTSLPDDMSGDGSSRILHNNDAGESLKIAHRKKQDAKSNVQPYKEPFSMPNIPYPPIPYPMGYDKSIPIGVGNVAIMTGRKTTDRHPLYHGTPFYDIHAKRVQTDQRRILYIITPY